jgi:uroporphyrinogen decarboxylase
MSPHQNHRFVKALRRQPVDKTPVWLMRQAGRYLPEYRRIRTQAKDFLQLCKTPELACEVTLQPLARFPLDAAIVFSDILTIPDAMGLGLYFAENEGPKFKRPVRSRQDIDALAVPDMADDLGYVMKTVHMVRHELNNKTPLIGFSGSPWTLATYMVEGGASKNFSIIKKWLFTQPEDIKHLLHLLADAIAAYLNAQIAAGAQAVMMFDTWGGILSPPMYAEFSLIFMRDVIEQIRRQSFALNTPIILFTKNGGQWLEVMADTGCDALGIDWMTDIGVARQRVGHKVALQGNMDPLILLSTPKRIEEEVADILQRYGDHPGHVFNLGHGILPATPIENVTAFVESVHRFSLRPIPCTQ